MANKKNTGQSQPAVPGEDPRINISGNENVTAVGPRSVAANIRIIFEGGWKPFAAVLTIIAVFLGLILWKVFPPRPQAMTAQFNVAVAEIRVKDKNGNFSSSADGKKLSAYFQQEISAQFNALGLDKVIPYDVWGAEATGVVDETDPNAPRALAEKINAQVLIYGLIDLSTDQPLFYPQFYINHKGYKEASEIVGANELGHGLFLQIPLEQSIPAIENPALAARVKALDLLTLGLAYYSIDDYEHAAGYFDQAANDKSWIATKSETNGKEVAYLLLGNAYVRWASRDIDQKHLPQADAAYTQALNLQPAYGRAVVGQANVLYLEALGDPASSTPPDTAKLDQAEKLTRSALLLPGQDASWNIPDKADFNLGQIYLARYNAKIPGDNWLDRAKSEFTSVTTDFETNKNDLVSSLAAHAYFRLGLIAYFQNDGQTAINMISKSLPLASPFYKADYTATLGDVYANLGDKVRAKQKYEEAIQIAASYNFPQKIDGFQKKLDALPGP